ncbi:GGDEF domain-containing protein [Magnetospirillum sp. UT-4]|uniref:GGDEF domain-containing protein n=1 Tax=Magnetospirillum sp. UT-4 TaxID=2681467 RepID=UPI0015731869|nr:GGDEF domain-containing protein [Magnetospirillum sp. UT-4]
MIDLVTERHHAPYLTRHRMEAVVSRVRMVAVAFSLLTLLWIGLDVATLELSQWVPIAIFRIIAVIAFIALATVKEVERSRTATLTMLGVILSIPMALFCIASFVLDGTTLDGLAAINMRLYNSLPFIVLAGLCIFPLVVTEGILFAVPVAITVALIQILSVGLTTVHLVSTLWVLGLSLGIYMLASAIQLHYMMALLRRASHDPLTGALTRRSGAEVIELHFRLACEQDAPFAIAFLDIDDFKGLNDVYGHEAGDQALRNAATALGKSLRQADSLVRWGGEEFVIVMTNTNLDGVRIAMGRVICDWLGNRPDGAPLTASIGVSERISDSAQDWSELIRLADERMYAAKKNGKARCLMTGGEMLTPATVKTEHIS